MIQLPTIHYQIFNDLPDETIQPKQVSYRKIKQYIITIQIIKSKFCIYIGHLKLGTIENITTNPVLILAQMGSG